MEFENQGGHKFSAHGVPGGRGENGGKGVKGEIDKDFYCSADLYDGQNELRVFNAISQIGITGDCIGVCKECFNYHRKHPTVEQYKEEYGQEYPYDGPVWWKYAGGLKKWRTHSLFYVKRFYKQAERYGESPPDILVVCACTPWGCPSVDWRPE